MVSRGTHAIGQVKQEAHQSARKASPALIALGRLGHVAEGVVYGLIGILAVQVALGRGGATTDNKGALAQIASAPFGRLLLIVITVGIVGFAIWRFLQAALDTDNVGTDGKGIAKRLGKAGSGVAHVALAFSAIRLLQTGNAGKSSTNAAQTATATLMSKPMGQWLVGIIGLIVVGVGMYQIYSGAKAKFREDLDLSKLSATEDTWLTRLGQVGHIARGVVFGLIGLFLVVAARNANPGEARGLDGALGALAQQPIGPWLLGVVAVGLVAYGVYFAAEARYRRMVV